MIHKVIIIGSGPAGLTAAIYAARANLNPLCIEGFSAGGQLMITSDVENYPGFENKIAGPELMDVFRKQAGRFGTEYITSDVTKVDFNVKPFKVWVGDKEYNSHSVILSTGANAKFLGLPSESRLMGKGVSACATCDGAFFKNQDVVVVGGGDTAMEEANFLTRFANRVYIVHRRDKFRASKIMADRAKNNPKIDVVWNSEIHDIKGEDSVEAVELKSGDKITTLKCQGLFIAIGHTPNTEIFKAQLKLNDNGYIITKDNSTYTSIDGVFASGDAQDSVYRQAVTAAGTGCMAAIDAERWLEKQGL